MLGEPRSPDDSAPYSSFSLARLPLHPFLCKSHCPAYEDGADIIPTGRPSEINARLCRCCRKFKCPSPTLLSHIVKAGQNQEGQIKGQKKYKSIHSKTQRKNGEEKSREHLTRQTVRLVLDLRRKRGVTIIVAWERTEFQMTNLREDWYEDWFGETDIWQKFRPTPRSLVLDPLNAKYRFITDRTPNVMISTKSSMPFFESRARTT